MMRVPRILHAIIVTGLLLVMLVPLALAHESRDVGKYRFVVGWAGEPAFRGERNGMDLTITNKDTNQPVEGLDKTLKAEVMFGGQKRELTLRGVFRQPGKYTADIVPTREGDYRFRFFGEIEGQKVDETFDSANGKFNAVQSIQAVQFPEAEPPAAQLNQAVQAADQKVTAAQAAAANAQTFGMIGIGAGVLGVALGAWALIASRRQPTGPTVPLSRPAEQ